MDYRSAIYQAQENESDKKSSTWYKAELGPSKKERREKKLSVNVQKFLAKKEEEERHKQLEVERKKRELLALRSQDKKSTKRVQSMLKRTKSANKSVIEDAIDNFNTALTAAGPLQPDEDDYGYVSKDAEELYNKLINKYNSMPAEQSPFSKTSCKTAKDISNTKDRVKAALQREEDGKLLPRKRKRKSKNENDDQNDKTSDEDPDKKIDGKNEDELETKRLHIPKNAQMPPPMDFQTLLKIAKEKQHEPIVIKKPTEEKQERPMTVKEKLEYMREHERKKRREMELPSLNTKNNDAAKNKFYTKTSSSGRSSDEEKLKSVPSSSISAVKSETKKVAKPNRPLPANVPNNNNIHKIKSSDSFLSKNTFVEKILSGDKTKCKEIDKSPQKSSNEDYKSIDKIDIKSNSEEKLKQENNPSLLKKSKDQYYAEQQCKNISSKPRNNNEKQTNLPSDNLISSRLQSNLNNNDTLTSKHSDSRIAKSFENVSKLSEKFTKSLEKKSIINSHSPMAREFSPNGTIREFPLQNVRQKPTQKPFRRKMIESDDEFDSEMDDFIDDSEDTTDISKHISDIFGYDRRKYTKYDQEEDEDECMESNFSDLQKEEFISTKHGILEDLAETRRKKLEKERMKKRLLVRN